MANTHSLDLESGSSQYASIADGSQTGLDITADLTIEACVKWESKSGGEMTIASKFQASTNRRAYLFMWNDASNKLQFYNSDNGTNSSQVDSTTNFDPTVDTWYHIAMVKDDANVKFYVNAVDFGGNTTLYATTHNSNAPFVIGAYEVLTTAQSFHDGKIDEMRVWNTARTQAEILANMETELVGDEAGLVAYYKLNNDFVDMTSNNNDLTGSGSPTFSTDVPFTGEFGGTNPMFFSGGGLTLA